jgi:outer membrane lipoprotein-sorting protein
MKIKLILLSFLIIFSNVNVSAQLADEIIDNYFENTGGIDNWRALTGTLTKASVNQGGMEIPLTIISLKDGRQLVQYEVQGKVLREAFDGEVSWSDNFMTMEAEKSDAETIENRKRESLDLPDPFLDYKEKGYTIELLGEETVEGVECYKIKLTKKPALVDGQDVDNISYYFFDMENFVPIVEESEIMDGEMKGKIGRIVFSDYDEVDGLYFPFSLSQGIKDMGAQTINFQSIELNPTFTDAMFLFPENTQSEETKSE